MRESLIASLKTNLLVEKSGFPIDQSPDRRDKKEL